VTGLRAMWGILRAGLWLLCATPSLARAAEPDVSVPDLSERLLPSLVVIEQIGRDGEVAGVGAGFMMSEVGLLATSLHVIGESRSIRATTRAGRRLQVLAVHAWDRTADLAILRVDDPPESARPLQLAPPEPPRQGTPILMLGNPQGLRHSVVRGVVSAVRDFDSGPMLQIAAPVESGNSGGPVVDMEGRVLGVVSLKATITDNLGFATPVARLRDLLRKPNTVAMADWVKLGSLNPELWRVALGGNWRRRASEIWVDGAGSGFGGRALCLSTKPLPEPPYSLSVEVRLDDESGAAGLAFAFGGGDRHFGFYPSAGQLRLTRFDGPDVYSWTILRQAPHPAHRLGDWNLLTVVVREEAMDCLVNGVPAFEGEKPPKIGGSAGLAKFRQTRAQFRNFQITPLGKDATPPGQPEDARLIAEAETLERQASALRGRALSLRQESVLGMLRLEVGKEEGQFSLGRAALLLSKLDNPHLDIAEYEADLAAMGEEIRARLQTQTVANPVDVLNQFLFSERGFHGSRTDYHNAANSYLDRVIDEREGLPITLAILYLDLAARAGLEGFYGLSLPSHFMVGLGSGESTRVIDVFDQGKLRTLEETRLFFLEDLGWELRPSELKAATPSEILTRMLRNLAGGLDPAESSAQLRRYRDALIAVNPRLQE